MDFPDPGGPEKRCDLQRKRCQQNSPMGRINVRGRVCEGGELKEEEEEGDFGCQR